MPRNRNLAAAGPPPQIGATHISTDALDERDSFAVWREVYGRHLFNLDIEAIGDEPFRADVTLRALPGASIVRSWRSASRTSVTRQLLSKSSDTLILAIITNGRGYASQIGREVAIPTGGAVLMSSADLASHTLLDDGCLLTLALPRDAVAPYVGDIDASIMRSFAPGSDALRLLTDYASSVLALGEAAKPELQGLAATHLRDLATMLLDPRDDARELATARGVRAARLRTIKSEILAQLDWPDLSAVSVALSLRITASYVRKLLTTEGTSFSDYVLSLRLERACASLQDRRLTHLNISSIAFAAGFSDISYFNRCFRRRFGMTPSDVRAGGLPQT